VSPEETRPEPSPTPQPQSATPGAVGTSGTIATTDRSLPDTGSSLPLMIFAAMAVFAAAGAVRALRYGL
jgi:hypothetical protein